MEIHGHVEAAAWGWVLAPLVGVACALTLLFLGMRSVLELGGFCAEGGPFELRRECPEHVAGVMNAAIWGGIGLSITYFWQAQKRELSSLAWLIWPALFLSLGWNFLEFGVNPPGGGTAWGWLATAVFFALMGGLPLVAVLRRGFTRRSPAPWLAAQVGAAGAGVWAGAWLFEVVTT